MICNFKILIYIFIATQLQVYISAASGNYDFFSSGKPRGLGKLSCWKNETCKSVFGEGGVCVNNECVCQSEEGCFRGPRQAPVTMVGEKCFMDSDCNVDHAVCNNDRCVCQENRVTSSDKRRCLPVAGGLGQRCEEDVQCLTKVESSICKNKKCVCDEIHHREMFKCWPNNMLGSQCTKQEECSNIIHARCSVICECEEGFVASTGKDKCLPVATAEDPACEEAEQCRHLYGYGAICERNVCGCDQVHRVANASACPTKLKQVCDEDDECRNYREDMSMHCLNGRCECLSPYVEEDGVCNSVTTIKPTTFGIVILLLCILVFYQ